MSDVNSIGSPTINMPFSMQDGGEPQAAASSDKQGSGLSDILNNFQGILGGSEDGGGGGLLNLNIVPNILSSNTNAQSGGGQAAAAPAASAPAPAASAPAPAASAPAPAASAPAPAAPSIARESNDAPRNDAPRFVSNNFQGISTVGGGSDASRCDDADDASGSVSNNFQGISNGGGGGLINANIVPNVLSRNESTQAA